ncbi:MAG: complex I NDUFA9 subunit family protein [Ktedonobacteraceae bacterium]|nr:complex I NDUFA9 subunit family protein [Ktedonobacteraceae bacterium]
MILITGATGYIGRHLVARLVAQGERPRCLVRDLHRAAGILPLDKVELVRGDTTHADTLQPAVSSVDTIVHAAFLTADRKQTPGNSYDETNVRGTRQLVDAAREAGVKHIIEISGLGTRPARTGSYMQGRYLAEQLVIESGLGWTILRPSVLFGKGAPFIKGLVDLVYSSPVVPLIGGGKTMFQPIYVEDVVSVLCKILANPAGFSGKIYTIGGPAYYSFSQIFDELLRTTHKRRLKVYAPVPLVRIGATAMEMLLARPPLTRAAMALFSFDNITDLESVERDFGFKPLSFHQYLLEQGV